MALDKMLMVAYFLGCLIAVSRGRIFQKKDWQYPIDEHQKHKTTGQSYNATVIPIGNYTNPPVYNRTASPIGNYSNALVYNGTASPIGGYTNPPVYNGTAFSNGNYSNPPVYNGTASPIGNYSNPPVYILPVEKPEPNDYFYPKGQDNTEPLDDNNILKDLPKNGCHEETKLLVGIRTAPVDFEERIWIRNNWGQYKISNTSVIFLIGHHKNSSITNQIAEEQSKHQDLLLMNFDDHYRNLSLKNYALFKYYLDYCPNAKCLLKPDVDTVTNILGFEKMCNVMSGSIEDQKMISSYVQRKQRVIRIPGNKWYVPRYVFPKEEYEEWAWGWGFLISGKNTVKDLVDTLRNKTPFLTSENYRRLPDDAIQTGDVRVLANISIQNPGGFGLAGKISLWKDPNSNNSVPLMVEAVSDKEGIWKEVQKFMDSS